LRAAPGGGYCSYRVSWALEADRADLRGKKQDEAYAILCRLGGSGSQGTPDQEGKHPSTPISCWKVLGKALGYKSATDKPGQNITSNGSSPSPMWGTGGWCLGGLRPRHISARL